MNTLCLICTIGWWANILLGTPYYWFVIRPNTPEDQRDLEIAGNATISIVPWLQVLRVVVVVGGGLAWIVAWKLAPWISGLDREEKDDD